jgi:perosamine synthetase
MTEIRNKKIAITRPSITELEIEYVNDAIANGWGEKCYDYIKRFEKEFAAYLGTKYALATSSCTGAIHLALMALGVKAGDEVIVPDITWIASVEPILYIGAKPVFVDVLPDSWCIDPSKIEAAITNKTKAIVAVHLYGNMAEMNEIMSLAKRHHLKVLEDAAEALGSTYFEKKAGSIADAGVFSFHGTKTVSTGEGGMMVTSDNAVIERARILNDHGRDPKIGKTFWMAEYGYKYKLSNLQAAMGCAQIERVEELVSKKMQIFEWYKSLFTDKDKFQLNPDVPHIRNSVWMPTVIFNHSLKVDRDGLMAFLKENGIDSRPFFYPLTSLPVFPDQKENKVSYDLFARGINLPSHPGLDYDDIAMVHQTVMRYIG